MWVNVTVSRGSGLLKGGNEPSLKESHTNYFFKKTNLPLAPLKVAAAFKYIYSCDFSAGSPDFHVVIFLTVVSTSEWAIVMI